MLRRIGANIKAFLSYGSKFLTIFLLLLVFALLAGFVYMQFWGICAYGWMAWLLFWTTWANLSLLFAKLKWDRKYKILAYAQFFFLLIYELFFMLPLRRNFLHISNRIKIQTFVETNQYLVFGLAYLLIFALWGLNAYVNSFWDKSAMLIFNLLVLTLHLLVCAHLGWYYRLVYKPYAYFRVWFEQTPSYAVRQWSPILEDIIRKKDWNLLSNLQSDFFSVHFWTSHQIPTHNTHELLNIFWRVWINPNVPPDYAQIPEYMVFRLLAFDDWAWWAIFIQKIQQEPAYLPFANRFMETWALQTERFMETANPEEAWFFKQSALENQLEHLLANIAPKLPDTLKERLEYICSLSFVGIGIAQNLDLPADTNTQ